MEKRDTGIKVAVVAALIISLVAVGVGFAAFATTLTINGTASVSSSSWDVHFKSVTLDSTNSTGTETTAPAINDNSSAGSNTSDTVIDSFLVTFSEPGQKVVYTAVVENSGTYTAKLTALDIAQDSELTCTKGTGATDTDATNVCKYINYSITGATKDETIAANGGTDTYTITIEYETFTDASELPTGPVTVTIPASTFTFSQSS